MKVLQRSEWKNLLMHNLNLCDLSSYTGRIFRWGLVVSLISQIWGHVRQTLFFWKLICVRAFWIFITNFIYFFLLHNTMRLALYTGLLFYRNNLCLNILSRTDTGLGSWRFNIERHNVKYCSMETTLNFKTRFLKILTNFYLIQTLWALF